MVVVTVEEEMGQEVEVVVEVEGSRVDHREVEALDHPLEAREEQVVEDRQTDPQVDLEVSILVSLLDQVVTLVVEEVEEVVEVEDLEASHNRLKGMRLHQSGSRNRTQSNWPTGRLPYNFQDGRGILVMCLQLLVGDPTKQQHTFLKLKT